MQSQRDRPGHDDASFADLYQRHAFVLLNYIRRHTLTREDAEDVLMEVFLAAYKHQALAGLSTGEQLGWLRRVAHNKCVDAYRRTQRQPAISLEDVNEILLEDEEQSPEQIALQSEEQAQLRVHLAHLSEQQQEILRLRFAQGMRSSEIARSTHKKEGTVRSLLARALNSLRGTYEKQEEGDSKHE